MPRRFQRLVFTAITLGVLTDQTVTAQEPSWSRVFDNYYISSIETTPFGLLTGEFDTRVWENPYNGIYISKDIGETWKPLGLEAKGITHIKYSTDIYATTYFHTDTPPGLYRSKDQGNTWELISPPYSSNYVEIIDNIIFLGTEAYGLIVSFDNGITWEDKIPSIRIEHVRKINNIFIASATNKTYQSVDNGKTWTKISYTKLYPIENYKKYNYELQTYELYENNNKTNLNLIGQDIAVTYTSPPYVFVSVNGNGIYRREIPQGTRETNPILNIPWEFNSDNELIDNITAYFDHEYPLLGYPYHSEPQGNRDTTVNFLGKKEPEPFLYYSSHNGTDYSLNYGDNVLAAASGIAKYYWCNACGNTIEIDHQNGYKTIYMHLQSLPITTNLNNTYVNTGEIIGKVGMTGNTTGPHLHFMVKKDNIVVDPYGWENIDYTDPWEIYSWTDTIGTHYGEKSSYLWIPEIRKEAKLINETSPIITLENKTIDFTNISDRINYTAIIRNYIKPTNILNTLRYIKNTSMLIEAVDLIGNNIKNLPDFVDIRINMSTLDLSKIILATVKIYHFNETLQQWEPLDTIIDGENNLISARTKGFSHFAIFGEAKYPNKYFLDTLYIKQTSFYIGTW